MHACADTTHINAYTVRYAYTQICAYTHTTTQTQMCIKYIINTKTIGTHAHTYAHGCLHTYIIQSTVRTLVNFPINESSFLGKLRLTSQETHSPSTL
jgi:hypothetical protein